MRRHEHSQALKKNFVLSEGPQEAGATVTSQSLAKAPQL